MDDVLNCNVLKSNRPVEDVCDPCNESSKRGSSARARQQTTVTSWIGQAGPAGLQSDDLKEAVAEIIRQPNSEELIISQRSVLAQLRRRGMDPAGLEDQVAWLIDREISTFILHQSQSLAQTNGLREGDDLLSAEEAKRVGLLVADVIRNQLKQGGVVFLCPHRYCAGVPIRSCHSCGQSNGPL